MANDSIELGRIRAKVLRLEDKTDNISYSDSTSSFSGSINISGNLEFARSPETKILFNSDINYGSDKAFILYKQDSAYHVNSSNENSRLSIGVFNDNENAVGEGLDLQGAASLIFNVGQWDSELNNIIGGQYNNVLPSSPIKFRINNSDVAAFSSSGNFGIGTTTPQSPLDVVGDIGLSRFLFFRTNASGYSAIQKPVGYRIDLNTGNGFWSGIHKTTDHPITIASQVNYPRVSDHWYYNNDGVNPTVIYYASLLGNLESPSLNPVYLIGLQQGTGRFGVMTNNTEKLTVLANGNVGIGTTTPQKPLDVATAGGIRISRTENSSSNNEIFFQDNGQISSFDQYHRIIFDRANDKLELREYGDIIFSAGATSATRTETVTIKNNGRVGIGTTAPGVNLSVKGQVSVSPVGTGEDIVYNGSFISTKPITSGQHINLIRVGNHARSLGFVPNTNTFAIAGGVSNDANFGNSIPFVIDDAGKVGIGTTAPVTKLQINSTDDTRGLRINNTLNTSYAEIQLAANAREYRIGTGGSVAGDSNLIDSFYVYDATAGQTRIKVSSAGVTTINQESWIAPTLLNSFSNFDTVNWHGAGYYKDSNGTVKLRGVIARAAGAALATPIFNLPAGYRPAKKCMFAITAGNGSARLDIAINGNITVEAASIATWYTFFSLDGLSFDTRS